MDYPNPHSIKMISADLSVATDLDHFDMRKCHDYVPEGISKSLDHSWHVVNFGKKIAGFRVETFLIKFYQSIFSTLP